MFGQAPGFVRFDKNDVKNLTFPINKRLRPHASEEPRKIGNLRGFHALEKVFLSVDNIRTDFAF